MNILTGKDSTVDGFTSLPFDVGKGIAIVHLFNAMGVVYDLGAKVKDIHAPTDAQLEFNPGRHGRDPACDCSGFSRFLVVKCSGAEDGGVVIPDGSVSQNDWFAAQGFKHHAAQEDDPFYLSGMAPDYAYVAFCRAGSRGEGIGHVWLLVFVGGRWWTLESCGGQGPTMRHHDTPILAHIVTDIYVLAKVA